MRPKSLGSLGSTRSGFAFCLSALRAIGYHLRKKKATRDFCQQRGARGGPPPDDDYSDDDEKDDHDIKDAEQKKQTSQKPCKTIQKRSKSAEKRSENIPKTIWKFSETAPKMV